VTGEQRVDAMRHEIVCAGQIEGTAMGLGKACAETVDDDHGIRGDLHGDVHLRVRVDIAG
jgi:hypothetical protein